MTSTKNILRTLKNQNQLIPYIDYIRFPQYKNLLPDTRIDFTYPITALVGPNGTNKSSVLKALYGVPGSNNVGNLWFSTAIDPIEEGHGSPNCFIYGYFNEKAGQITEVLKSRIKKENDPDYWEPSRPIAKYGMTPFKKDAPAPEGGSKTRWNTISKNVVYIDFRAALSAFDKFFYYGQIRNKGSETKAKKALIRSRSPHLKSAINSGAKSYEYYNERIVNRENRTLAVPEVKAVSKILGREYSEIKLVRHSFFDGDGYTAQLKTKSRQYTEAFAGSGEFSVIALVNAVSLAEEKSLILLDEPEVSLHPGAQERLMDYLMDAVKHNKHQIVLSTHSPAFVRQLPEDAIKVMIVDNLLEKVTIPKQASLPEEAFFHLGDLGQGRRTILVEDKLGKAIVEKALRLLGQAFSAMFEVKYYPGGAETLWKFYASPFALADRQDIFILLDGDKRTNNTLPAVDEITPSQEKNLAAIIKNFTNVDLSFPVDGGAGGGNNEQRVDAQKKFITWVNTHVNYLPGIDPEEFVWTSMTQDKIEAAITIANPKEKFKLLARSELGLEDFETIDASQILATQQRKVASIPSDNAGILCLQQILNKFANI
ncbi:ATP-dependent nuclease [Undibacterium sp. TC4M20W]|uniref:ATP-dependent nuclease n=1 Tax=Undibacterium sp. TC4M20W TaxID=3413052 RepID=UPI003BF08066